MKTTNKNNPVAVGALLGILGATLFLLMKQTSGGNAPATLTSVADTHSDEASKTTPAIASQSLQRDPFDHPALHRIAKEGMVAQNSTPEAPNSTLAEQSTQTEAHRTLTGSKVSAHATNGSTASVLPILPDYTQAHTALANRAAMGKMVSGAIVPSNPGISASGANAPVQEADDPLKGWRLTATIGGQHPRAVIEGPGIGTYRVGIGERIGALEVAAIHEREIVLSDAHHLYTLSLMSASFALEDSKTGNDNKDASVETITTTARENENGTVKIHP